MKIIDSHAHIVQYIAGIGSGGELRSIGGGMARYAKGQVVRMIPEQFNIIPGRLSKSILTVLSVQQATIRIPLIERVSGSSFLKNWALK